MSQKFKKLIQTNEHSQPNYLGYIPNYKKMGINPTDGFQQSIIINNDDDSKSLLISSTPTHGANDDNPRTRRPAIVTSRNVPYAETSTHEQIKNIPNVGNNLENTWVGIDNDIIDDNGNITDFNSDSDEDVIDNDLISSNEIGDYVLIYNGSIIYSGSLEEVQKEVKDLIFGEHLLCKSSNIEVSDLIVLKKIKIKVGVFLE